MEPLSSPLAALPLSPAHTDAQCPLVDGAQLCTADNRLPDAVVSALSQQLNMRRSDIVQAQVRGDCVCRGCACVRAPTACTTLKPTNGLGGSAGGKTTHSLPAALPPRINKNKNNKKDLAPWQEGDVVVDMNAPPCDDDCA